MSVAQHCLGSVKLLPSSPFFAWSGVYHDAFGIQGSGELVVSETLSLVSPFPPFANSRQPALLIWSA